jgi:hypothetical protein
LVVSFGIMELKKTFCVDVAKLEVNCLLSLWQWWWSEIFVVIDVKLLRKKLKILIYFRLIFIVSWRIFCWICIRIW